MADTQRGRSGIKPIAKQVPAYLGGETVQSISCAAWLWLVRITARAGVEVLGLDIDRKARVRTGARVAAADRALGDAPLATEEPA